MTGITTKRTAACRFVEAMLRVLGEDTKVVVYSGGDIAMISYLGKEVGLGPTLEDALTQALEGGEV